MERNEDKYNESFTDSTFQYAKFIYITFTLGRIILVLISIKNLRVCKLYFYYEQIVFLSSLLMPIGMSAEDQNELNLVGNLRNFSYFYFDLWPCVICTMLTQNLAPVLRSLMYVDEHYNATVIGTTIILMLQVFMGYIIVHIIFTQLGFNFLGAEVERSSNRELITNLDEGVLILEQETQDVIFYNYTGKKFLSCAQD